MRGPSFWQTHRMVIDPSLFTTPVSFATWKGVQGDPAATLTDTVADQFWHGGGTDPTYSASNQILVQYRPRTTEQVEPARTAALRELSLTAREETATRV